MLTERTVLTKNNRESHSLIPIGSMNCITLSRMANAALYCFR